MSMNVRILLWTIAQKIVPIVTVHTSVDAREVSDFSQMEKLAQVCKKNKTIFVYNLWCNRLLCTNIFILMFENMILKDINECTEGTHGCQHLCENTVGSFYCKCNPGYILDSDGKSCYGD